MKTATGRCETQDVLVGYSNRVQLAMHSFRFQLHLSISEVVRGKRSICTGRQQVFPVQREVVDDVFLLRVFANDRVVGVEVPSANLEIGVVKLS